MKTNKAKTYRATTHEGGRADPHQSPLTELTRAVSSCLLFESTFYEGGASIANRIAALCQHVEPHDIANLAVHARTMLKLRHVPLFLVVQLLTRQPGRLAAETIAAVVQRPDEMGELLALYWKAGRKPLSAQLKKGLAAVFPRFTAYQLAKWNRDAAVKLRDVMFLVHPTPTDAEQAATWKALVDGTLEAPDTWEVALSAGADKRATWTRLLEERKLGYLALLMNLRNMSEAGVDAALVSQAIREGAKGSKALPFRFVAAARHAPQYMQALSEAMELAIEGSLPGKTVVLVDVSGSMQARLSQRGELTRVEAAAALAVLVRALTPHCRIFLYSTHCWEIGNLRGLGLVQEIVGSQGGSTETWAAVQTVAKAVPDLERLIVVTDEQAHDDFGPCPAVWGYVLNVAPYAPGLELGGSWVRINGWSESVVRWIQQYEEEREG